MRASHVRRDIEKSYFSRLSPFSLSIFTLAPDLSLDRSRVLFGLVYAKIGTLFLESVKKLKKKQKNFIIDLILKENVSPFPRSRPSSKSFVKFSMCSYERGGRGAGSFLEISVSGLKILPYEHFSPVTGMNSGGPDGVVLHCLLCFPHEKHPSAAIQL